MALIDPSRVYSKLLICFALPVLFLLYKRFALYRTRAKYSECKDPPKYPQKDFLLGLDVLREIITAVKSKCYLQKLHQDYVQYGSTFSKHFLFSSIICTVEPDNLKCILSTNFRDYGITSVRKDAFRPFLGDNILTADGAEWTHARANLRPSFSKKQTGDLDMFEVHVNNLVHAIRNREEGETVDLRDLFLSLTADIATESFYGESVDSLRSGSLSSIMEAFQIANRGCEDRARRGKLAMFFPQGKLNKSIKVMRQYIEKYVMKDVQTRKKQRSSEEAATNDRYVLLHELSKVITDRDRLRNELLTIFFAGRDTTGSLLCSLFFTLARRSDVWLRLRSEVAYLKGEKPTVQDLQHLQYTKCVLNEILRLYPPLPHNARVALKDTILPLGGGPEGQDPVFVSAGTKVEFHASALHRRQDLWGKDADDFRPERWESDASSWVRLDNHSLAHCTSFAVLTGRTQKFLAFSGGPRQCIGQQFGFTVALYTTVRLVQAFEILESRDSEPWTENLGVVCFPTNGVKVAMSPDRQTEVV